MCPCPTPRVVLSSTLAEWWTRSFGASWAGDDVSAAIAAAFGVALLLGLCGVVLTSWRAK